MLPLEPGCHALIINAGTNNGEVIVGNPLGEQDGYMCPPHWEINKPFTWNADLGLPGFTIQHHTTFCPEKCLMRIDGNPLGISERKKKKDKPKEPVLDDA